MNIVFFGTSVFAIPSLRALVASPHKILLVVTQPDKKKGRHLHLTPPPIKDIATGLNLPVFQPADVSSGESINRLKALNADLFAVAAFGQLFKKEALEIPRKFAINLHGSLLPKYRGAAPINWAIINGEKKTGVSVFRLEEKMDAGDIILDKEINIEEEDNAITLNEKLSQLGAQVLAEAVDLIEAGKAAFREQDEVLVSCAPRLKKSDGLIDWNLPAEKLHNITRGLLPWPVAFTKFDGRRLKVLEARAVDCKNKELAPGQIVDVEPGLGILVRTGEGCLAVQRLQLEGSRPMGFEEFLRGHKLRAGSFLAIYLLTFINIML